MLRLLAALAALCIAALGGAEEPKNSQDPEVASNDDLHGRLEELPRSQTEVLAALRRDLNELHVKFPSGEKFQRLSNALARLEDSKAAHRRGRRLWSWPDVGVDAAEIKDAATEFVEESTDDAGEFIIDTAIAVDKGVEDALDSALGAFTVIKEQFGEMNGMMDACKAVLDSAWAATTGFGVYMEGIFSNFLQIEPYFNSHFGMLPLLASEELMVVLIQTIDMLLDSTRQLSGISRAIEFVAEPLSEIKGAIEAGLKKLSHLGKRRLLTTLDLGDLRGDIGEYAPDFDYSNLLAGLDPALSDVPAIMQSFIAEADKISVKFSEVREVIRPIIERIKQHYGMEIESEHEGDAPTEVTGNGTFLADGDSDTKTNRRLRAQVSQLHRRLMALDAVGVGREVGASAWSHGLDRRLVEDVGEVQKDQEKYEKALLSITPSWQEAETLAQKACHQIDLATERVDSLVCRVETFISQPTIPNAATVEVIASECDAQSIKNITGEGDCPAQVMSLGLREGFSGSAGIISFGFALVEYLIQNFRFLSIILAFALLGVGCVCAFMGYYVKSVIEFFQGCCGGLVLWSMFLSVMIMWFDMCRGGGVVPHCDATAMVILVLVLSVLSGVFTWKLDYERFEAALSGFTTGAFAAGAYYIILYRDEMLGGFLDPDSAKPYMASLMIIMLLVGSMCACLTQVLFRQLLMMGTAIVGSLLILLAVMIFVPHWWSTWDWVAWAVLSVASYLVQLLVTPPDYEIMDEGERAEYRKQLEEASSKA